MVGFTLPWGALPAQQLWALHFHVELCCLHNNGGLYTSMRSSTCTTIVGFRTPWQALHFFEKPTVSHFPSTSPLAVLFQFPLVHDISKSASVFTQGKDLSCGLHWNHAHAWLCLVWALVPVRPQALPTTYSHQQPTIHALYSKTSQVSFSLLIWPTN